jgi:hypothetical protein
MKANITVRATNRREILRDLLFAEGLIMTDRSGQKLYHEDQSGPTPHIKRALGNFGHPPGSLQKSLGLILFSLYEHGDQSIGPNDHNNPQGLYPPGFAVAEE